MSDIIKIGTQDATFKVGSSAVTAIFLGSTQVYPEGEPPTLKYKLTLSNGDIVSAETDATSAITRNEVSAYSATCVSAEIGDTVTSIGASTFNGFNNLSSVTIGTNVTTINVYAFNRCSGLTEVVFPDSITYIGGGAFDNCKSISSITLSNNITQIGMGAFRSCSSLQNIVIPSSVTSIEGQAFLFDSSLQSITVNASNPPTLGSDVFLETGNCPIYCPCQSLSLYQQNWAEYASRLACIPTPSYQWVSYTTGDTVPTATTTYGVKLYANYDESYNVIFSGTTGDYIKFHPNGDFGQWSAEDENGNSISISSYFIPGSMMYTIEFSDLGLGGMNIISPATFEDDIDLYVTN